MSSYYGGGWAAYEVNVHEADQSMSGSSMSQASHVAGSEHDGHRAGSTTPQVSRYDIGTDIDAASDASWWNGEGSWSWTSWDDSSASGRENWAYVTRHGDRRGRSDHSGEWSDEWHRWHRDGHRDGHLGQPPRPGRGGDSGVRGANDHGRGQSDESVASEAEGPRGELPSGRVNSVEEKTEREEARRTQGKVTSTYPPVFRARQGENYRDWKRAVRFWMKGEGQQLPTSIVGPRVMVQLRERAAQLVKHLEPEDVDGEGGLQRIFDTLEKNPADPIE